MEHLPPWLRNVPLPPPPTDADDTPDWLRGIDSFTPPPSTAARTPDWLTEPAEQTEAASIPDWLAELQAEVTDPLAESGAQTPWIGDVKPEPTAERPSAFGTADWLQGSDDEPPPTTSSRLRMPVGPTDWLRSMGHEEEGESAAQEPAAEAANLDLDSGVPDWLRELSEEEITQALATTTPEPSSTVTAANTPSEPEPADWLSELDRLSSDTKAPTRDWLQEGTANDETILATNVPEWLTPDQPLTPETSAPDLPPWLQNIAGDEPPAAPGSVRLDLPSWLLEEDSPQLPTVAPDAPTLLADSNVMFPQSGAVDQDIPTWLKTEPPASVPEASADIPTWLRELESTEQAEQQATESGAPAWLQEAEPATAEAPDWLQAAEPPTSDVPAWLQEAEPATTEAPDWLRAAEPPTSDVPAWLQEAEPATTEAPDWLRAAEPPTSDVPAWLQEAEPATAEAPDWLRAAEPPTSDVPDWLQEAEPATADAPDWLQSVEPPTGDVPAWLQEAEPATAEAPGWLQAAEPPASDVPDWLREETGAPSATSATDVPAWLREAEPATTEAPGWLQAAEPSAADVPAWLQAAEPPAADVPAWLQEPSSGTIDTPDWLVTNAPAAAIPWLEAGSAQSSPVTEPPPTTSSTSDEFLSGAELPPWLRASSERVAEPAVTPSLSWLQRLGSREADESEAVWAGAEVTVVRPPLPGPAQRTSDQIAAVALLERLLQSPLPVTMPAEQPVVARRRLPVLEQLLALVLLLAILIGLLFPGLTATLTNQVQPSPAAVALYDQLASLGSEDVVLIAYEWGAQRVAELRPLESALLAELTDERTKLIIVSTDLQGTLLSFDLIGPLRAAGYNNENGVTFGGRDYVLLGYRPGGELALRSLALDLRAELRRDYTGQDATAGLLATRPDGTPRIEKLNDLAMIVVLADQVQDVQAWMEQIHSAAPDVPIAFLLPQEVYPQVLPYLRLPGVYAVAGQRGAIDLLAAGNADEKAAYALSFQTWSTLVFIGVLALGVLIVGIGRLFHLIRGKY